MYSSLTVILGAAALLLIQPQANSISASALQGKGGTIKPVPTPTPTPRKVTSKKTAPTSTRVNTRPNPSGKSKEDEAAAIERTYWETVRNSTDPEDFKSYLKKYPGGQFADLANNRIRALEAAAKPQPSPTHEPTYEWTKSERDLPAPVRLEFYERNLSFSVPSGWTRTQREQGSTYLQINFRSPDSPQTNISIQLYRNGLPHTLRNGAAELWYEEKNLVDDRRDRYASQKVSTKLTDTEVIHHPTGRWQTFTADVLDANALERTFGGIVPPLDAVYPDDVWLKTPYDDYQPKPGSLSAFIGTRHSYAIRQAGGDFIVMVYTAPIEKFDEKMLPSVMATLKMSGGEIEVAASSDSSVGIYNYEPEIVIDGEHKGLTWTDHTYPVGAGKHHVIVRAKQHKPFEKDVFVGGWEHLKVEVKLERTASSTSGAKPK
jgi:hypothetical protein